MRYEVTFGVGKDRHGNPLDPYRVQATVEWGLKEAGHLVGGASLIAGLGVCFNDDGEYVEEPNRTILLDGDVSDEEVHALANEIGVRLDQSSVHVVRVFSLANNRDVVPEYATA